MKSKGFMILVLLSSCVYTEKASILFRQTLNKNKPYISEKIKFEGCYVEVTQAKIPENCLARPLIFYENGIIAQSDSEVFYKSSLKHKFAAHRTFGSFFWGTYDIENDTIKAIIYQNYYGMGFMRTQFRQVQYIGVVKSKNTIKNWHRVPSEIDSRINKDIMDNGRILKEQETLKNLTFHEMPTELLPNVDSAWVNKYKYKDMKRKR